MARPDERTAVIRAFVERFGIEESAFANLAFFLRGRNVWAVAKSPHLEAALSLGPATVGIRLARLTNLGLKPTSAALQILGKQATRNRVTLDREGAVRFLRGEDLPLRAQVQPGFVVVCHEDQVLGCGLYKGSGLLRSLIPRRIRLDAPDLPEPGT